MPHPLVAFGHPVPFPKILDPPLTPPPKTCTSPTCHRAEFRRSRSNRAGIGAKKFDAPKPGPYDGTRVPDPKNTILSE